MCEWVCESGSVSGCESGSVGLWVCGIVGVDCVYAG